MAEDYKLIDNEEKHRYEFQIDGKIAEIDYIKSNNGEIYLVHTEVPVCSRIYSQTSGMEAHCNAWYSY